MKNKNIKVVILDFDGTIGDTQPVITTTMLQTINVLHLPHAHSRTVYINDWLTVAADFHAPHSNE
jgi:beta-phosphoglucomutase-like phosphatase (HAD superfamily)